MTFAVMRKGKVMDDVISRAAAIDALKEHRALYCDNTPDTFSKLSYAEKSRVDELDTSIATLVNLPSADRPKGRWIKRLGTINCSVCKHSHWADSFEDLLRSFNYCPNCGCRMKGAGNE